MLVSHHHGRDRGCTSADANNQPDCPISRRRTATCSSPRSRTSGTQRAGCSHCRRSYRPPVSCHVPQLLREPPHLTGQRGLSTVKTNSCDESDQRAPISVNDLSGPNPMVTCRYFNAQPAYFQTGRLQSVINPLWTTVITHNIDVYAYTVPSNISWLIRSFLTLQLIVCCAAAQVGARGLREKALWQLASKGAVGNGGRSNFECSLTVWLSAELMQAGLEYDQ